MNSYDVVPDLGRHIRYLPLLADSGAIDQDVDTAEIVDACPDQFAGIVEIRHGTPTGNGGGAFGLELLNDVIEWFRILGGPLGIRLAAVDHHIRTLCCKSQRNGPADPEAGTRYNRILSAQYSVHCMSKTLLDV
jgi:hypothetical protein